MNINTAPTTATRRALAALGGLTLVLAACGGSDTAQPAVQAEPVASTIATAEPTAAPAVVTPAATAGTTALGDVLVGERGLTLYGFTNDVEATSACYGTCADAWPPVIVSADWIVAPGLDSGIFNATVRDDGQLQLVAGKWPLYYFAGDATAGDTNGQGSGDVWFAVATDGSLISESDSGEAAPVESADEANADESVAEASPLVSIVDSDLGSVLVDSAGLSLYGFTNDIDGVPTCNEACADAWPPVIVEGDVLPAGLDPAVFSVTTRDDGSSQLKAGAWPLYLFAGDAAPGDTNGQGSGDVWFVANAEGGMVNNAAQGATTPDSDDAKDAGGYDY